MLDLSACLPDRPADEGGRDDRSGGLTLARVVVTGGAGFVGAAIVHALRGRGDEVFALDVSRGPGVRQADVSRPGAWEKDLAGADLVVHAAATGLGGVGELPA